jgi:plastocyanin
VETGDYYFRPSELAMQPGEATIQLTNHGPRRHTLNVRDLGNERDLARSPRIVQGDTVPITFTILEEGVYRIYCSEPGHLDEGHVGTLTVRQGPGAGLVPEGQPLTRAPVPERSVADVLTLVTLWIHVPLVVAWIGFAMLDAFAVFAHGLSVGQRGSIVASSRVFTVVALVAITVTGIWQTMDNPFRPVTSYETLTALREIPYGAALFWKHGFVLATFGLSLAARFVVAPKMVAESLATASDPPGGPPALQRWLLWLSLGNLAACLGALILATRMIWELH